MRRLLVADFYSISCRQSSSSFCCIIKVIQSRKRVFLYSLAQQESNRRRERSWKERKKGDRLDMGPGRARPGHVTCDDRQGKGPGANQKPLQLRVYFLSFSLCAPSRSLLCCNCVVVVYLSPEMMSLYYSAERRTVCAVCSEPFQKGNWIMATRAT